MSIRENLIKKAIEADVESTLAQRRMRDAYKMLTEDERWQARREAAERLCKISAGGAG